MGTFTGPGLPSTSTEIAAKVTDETGTGALVFSDSPVFVSPALGTPASGVMTNVTGVPAAAILAGSFGAGAYVVSTSLQAATIELGHATDTTLARTGAGDISIEGNAVYHAGGTDVPVADGGTGASTFTDAGVLIGNTTGAIQVTSAGTSGQVLTSNGAGVDPTFQAAAGGATGAAVRVNTCFETAGRFTGIATGGGAVTFGTSGAALSTSATGTSSEKLLMEIDANGSEFVGSPVWSSFTYLETAGSDFTIGMWLGSMTITGTALTLTTNHAGFKMTRAASGTINLYATQGDGTTETASASLATPANGWTIRFICKVNGAGAGALTSIDYYWARTSTAISAATNMTGNLPTTLVNWNVGVTNITVAANTAFRVSSLSYEAAG